MSILFFVVSAVLAVEAYAQPHGMHAAHQQAHKRGGGVVTEWVTTTVMETVTVSIDGDFSTTIYPVHASTSPPAVAAITTDNPAQFFEGSTTSTPAVPSVVPSPPAQAVPPAEQDSSSGAHHAADSHTGDMTFYTVGLGACGDNDAGQGDTQNIVALSADLMGAQSNGNAMCGRTITIERNGKKATGTVKDKCPGCSRDSIDVSNHLFKLLADESEGRVQVTWSFN